MRAMRRHLFKNDLDHWASSFFDALRGQADGQPTGRAAGRPSAPLSPAGAGPRDERAPGGPGRRPASRSPARRPLLVASDYDGVLARLAGRPVGGGPRARGRRGAGPAGRRRRGDGRAGQRPRASADLQATSGFDRPLPLGGQPRRGVRRAARPASWPTGGTRWPRCWRPWSPRVPGARLEVKPASVAVHVRQVPDRAGGRRAAGAALGTLVDSSLTMKPGKEVLELAVTDADKGTALRRLRRRARRRRGALPRRRRHRRGRLPRARARTTSPSRSATATTAARYRVRRPRRRARACSRRLGDLLA